MNKFPREYQPTVFDNYTTSIKINSQIISLGLWYLISDLGTQLARNNMLDFDL